MTEKINIRDIVNKEAIEYKRTARSKLNVPKEFADALLGKFNQLKKPFSLPMTTVNKILGFDDNKNRRSMIRKALEQNYPQEKKNWYLGTKLGTHYVFSFEDKEKQKED